MVSQTTHGLLGAAIVVVALIVGLWALLAMRRGGPAPRSLTIGVLLTVGLLLIQILLGMERWVDVGVPGMSLRGFVHTGGPIVALIVSLGLIVGEAMRSPGRYAIAMLLIAATALLSHAVRLLI